MKIFLDFRNSEAIERVSKKRKGKLLHNKPKFFSLKKDYDKMLKEVEVAIRMSFGIRMKMNTFEELKSV